MSEFYPCTFKDHQILQPSHNIAANYFVQFFYKNQNYLHSRMKLDLTIFLIRYNEPIHRMKTQIPRFSTCSCFYLGLNPHLISRFKHLVARFGDLISQILFGFLLCSLVLQRGLD